VGVVASAALIVAIVSAVVTVVGLYFAKRAADAATTATRMERERRHAEMRPRYLVTCEEQSPGTEQRLLLVKLVGPGELEALDELAVTIRDYSHFRLKPAPGPGNQPQPVPDEVWGPLRFVPGTGPGVTTRPGAVGADPAGRTTSSVGMPVGEEHVYALDRTFPPHRTSLTREQWFARVGPTLRLRIEGRKLGWDAWVAVGELDTSLGKATAEVT
jgi:hypothetical protein